MHFSIVENNEPTKIALIQKFFEDQSSVYQARVWKRNSKLLARVVVDAQSLLSEIDLRLECEKTLGKKNTPHLILLERKVAEQEYKVA